MRSYAPKLPKSALLAVAVSLALCGSAASAPQADGETSRLMALYRELHAAPELSFGETETAGRLAREIGGLGYTVIQGVGGTGLAAVMRNGAGPILLIRTDMDALPIREETGLPFASTVTRKTREGDSQPAMHACGHDIHMTSWVGVARRMAAEKARWHGTLILVAQPAEERVGGARAMLKDGLYAKTATPTHILAFHDSAAQPAGTLGWTPGPALAAVDTVDITVKGQGSHGASPQLSKDPIVTAARIVLGLQTIVSREIDPQDAAVVTVGAINGGSKNNIIPDRVELKLTLRSFSDATRAHLVDAVRRTARGEAIAAGMPTEPDVRVSDEGANVTVNTPALAERIAGVFRQRFGAERVQRVAPATVSEDFNEFGRAAPQAETFMFWVGAQPKAVFDAAGGDLTKMPGLHTARWAPDAATAIPTAVEAMTAAALSVLGGR
jgi:hippurate hydrolase